MTPREEVLGIIRERRGHDDVLTVPRAFIELTGDHATALFLSQLLYWTDRTQDPRGWVYKSHAEWKQELGMGRTTVDRARRRLVDLGVLHQACRQTHGRRTMFFRIDLMALRSALMLQTAMLNGRTPRRRVSADRSVEKRQTDVSSFDTPETETTPETTPETTAETTRSSNTRAKGEESREEGESRSGAPDGSGSRLAASAPGGRGSPPLREDAGMLLAEDRLFAILERVGGFPRERDHAQLRELLDDYPEVDHLLELKKFAAFYEKRVLDRPWFALLNWLDKASMKAARRLLPGSFVGDPPPAGEPRPAPPARKKAEPLPGGVVVAGPHYWKVMTRRRREDAAPQ